MIVAIITFPGGGWGTCALLPGHPGGVRSATFRLRISPATPCSVCMSKQISHVSGEEVSGMTITTRNLHGACRVPSAPVLRTPGRRFSTVHGRVKAPCRSMAAVYQTAMDLIPATVVA